VVPAVPLQAPWASGGGAFAATAWPVRRGERGRLRRVAPESRIPRL